MAELTLGMKATILKTSLGLGAAGVLGAFAAHGDLIAIAPAWAGMYVSLAEQAGQRLDRDRALKITTGVLGGAMAFVGGIKLANTYFAYTGIGTVPAVVINSGTNALVTWLAGRAWAQVALEEDLEQSVDNLIRAVLGVLAGWLPARA